MRLICLVEVQMRLFKFPSADDVRPASVTTPVFQGPIASAYTRSMTMAPAMRRRVTPRVTFLYLTRLSWPP